MKVSHLMIPSFCNALYVLKLCFDAAIIYGHPNWIFMQFMILSKWWVITEVKICGIIHTWHQLSVVKRDCVDPRLLRWKKFNECKTKTGFSMHISEYYTAVYQCKYQRMLHKHIAHLFSNRSQSFFVCYITFDLPSLIVHNISCCKFLIVFELFN